MNQYKCSVIMIQYNPCWEKIRMTLNSIISQNDCSYEIIVADDGSKCTYFDKIKAYFEVNKFKDYHFVENKENIGTVRNVISGVRAAKGKYVRVIAPGDMLYSENTLQKIVDFMDEHNAKEMFGRMAFYNKDGEVNLLPKQLPFDIQPYKASKKKCIKKHLLTLGDNISGASYTWEKEYYLDCLMRICGKVIYMEDCINAFTIYDGHDICFMDEFVTWYEYGTGISTVQNNKWTQLLIKDWLAFLEEMDKRYPKDIYIKKAYAYYKMSTQRKICNKILKNIVFFDRYLFGYIKTRVLYENEYLSVEKEKLLQYMASEEKLSEK